MANKRKDKILFFYVFAILLRFCVFAYLHSRHCPNVSVFSNNESADAMQDMTNGQRLVPNPQK
jgi:hypothetical protein